MSLFDLGKFLILVSISFPFYETLGGLRTCAYFSTQEMFLMFMIFLLFGGNISCVKLLVGTFKEDLKEVLFDDPDKDDFGK